MAKSMVCPINIRSDGIPDKNQLNQIWENREIINKSLNAIGGDVESLDPEEYWSSTAYNGSAAFCQHFDDGKVDHTTKDHEFAIAIIREWTEE